MDWGVVAVDTQSQPEKRKSGDRIQWQLGHKAPLEEKGLGGRPLVKWEEWNGGKTTRVLGPKGRNKAALSGIWARGEAQRGKKKYEGVECPLSRGR